MLDLALNGAAGPVPLADIAGRQSISLAYLEQLFARLRRVGLVRSVRGPGGGYLLGAAEEEISVARIISAVDESLDATRCGGAGTCQDGQTCLTHDLWSDLSNRIDAYLQEVTLAALMARDRVRAVAQRQQQTAGAGRSRIAATHL
jgi:Rrf2 family iron-sulfur cluster assembly transcriptional regulator